MGSKLIYTIGHSTRSIEEFIDLLQGYAVEVVLDVRTIPKSRHNPQFNKEALTDTLQQAGMHYRHLLQLGGLRHTTKDSVNTGWRNQSFRGYADYMQTPAFWEGLEELKKIAKKQTCVAMCAEAVPWRCHRSLIADALTLEKWKVLHIMSQKKANAHVLTSFLHSTNGQLIYADTPPAGKDFL